MEAHALTTTSKFFTTFSNPEIQSLSRFLSLSACPLPDCRAPLELISNQLICTSPNKHIFDLSPNGDFFLFAPPESDPTSKLAATSIYASERIARHYAGLWCFAHHTLYDQEQLQKGFLIGRGESDMFYRIITELILERFQREGNYSICDIGCGVGRLTYDLSGLYPNSFITGFDISENMLLTASKMLFTQYDFDIDLSDAGFGIRRIDRKALPPRPDVFIFQANAERMPIKSAKEEGGFDLVLNINVLDRSLNPDIVLQSSLDITKPGGSIIIAISSSWQEGYHWERFGSTLSWCLDFLKENNFTLNFGIDRVMFREITNSRGAFEEYPIAILLASKDKAISPIQRNGKVRKIVGHA